MKFGELVVNVPLVQEPDGLEKLVFTRGLLTCCKMDILSCQLESFTHPVGELKSNTRGLESALHEAGSCW